MNGWATQAIMPPVGLRRVLQMLRVVLIDDDPLTVLGLKSYIEWHDYGFEVVGEALDGVAGLEVCRRLRPDLALVDLRMPGFSGLELIENLRGELRDTHFVILSAYGEFELAQRAIRAGVSDYLIKPIQKGLFIELLKAIASRRADRLAASSQNDIRNPIVREIIDFIRSNLHRDTALTEVAEEVGHSPSYVSALFHREVGVTFLTYVTQAKLERAKILLRDTEERVGSVAANVGYRSGRYFSQVFRRHEGCTPSEYREQRR